MSYLPALCNYGVSDAEKGKADNKAELQRLFGLPESPSVPVIAMVSRLASHKGFDLVRYAMERILEKPVQFVLLGTGESGLEAFFESVARLHPDRVGVMFAFNKALAKQIYAGADLFLMPSKSEPCGLAQMIASRYGAIPIVREVGGLYDTIHAFDPTTGTGNGVTFYSYDAMDMLDAVHRALNLYEDRESWAVLRRNAMEMDFSWNASAKQYLSLYHQFF